MLLDLQFDIRSIFQQSIQIYTGDPVAGLGSGLGAVSSRANGKASTIDCLGSKFSVRLSVLTPVQGESLSHISRSVGSALFGKWPSL